MTPQETNARISAAPVVAAFVLLATFGLLLALLLSQANLARQGLADVPIVTHVPVQVAALPDITPEPTPEIVAAAPTLDPAMIAAGETTFNTFCVACHGQGARGIRGLGKDLVASEFIYGLTDEEQVQFITGRPAFDPANTTGVEMPARRQSLADRRADRAGRRLPAQSGAGRRLRVARAGS